MSKLDEFAEAFQLDPENREVLECGKRIAGTYAMHRLADPYGVIGHFFAVRLSDGRSNDGNPLYPSMAAAREDIARHDDENNWMYVQIVVGTLDARDAAILLKTQRKMHDAGFRVSSSNGRQIIPRLSREDNLAQLRSVFKGTPPKNIVHGRTRY